MRGKLKSNSLTAPLNSILVWLYLAVGIQVKTTRNLRGYIPLNSSISRSAFVVFLLTKKSTSLNDTLLLRKYRYIYTTHLVNTLNTNDTRVSLGFRKNHRHCLIVILFEFKLLHNLSVLLYLRDSAYHFIKFIKTCMLCKCNKKESKCQLIV